MLAQQLLYITIPVNAKHECHNPMQAIQAIKAPAHVAGWGLFLIHHAHGRARRGTTVPIAPATTGIRCAA